MILRITSTSCTVGLRKLYAKSFTASLPLRFDRNSFQQTNLNDAWDLARKFDLVICLEVAEHLLQSSARPFIASLTRHSDSVVFSAAVPGQVGQGHINCQWPTYWQSLFNECGYECLDVFRHSLWDLDIQEYWYKQNMFLARRNPDVAGSEERLLSLVHPQLYQQYLAREDRLLEIADGRLPLPHYLGMLKRRLKNYLW